MQNNIIIIKNELKNILKNEITSLDLKERLN